MSDVTVALERLPASHGIALGGHISAHTSASRVVLDVPVGYLSKGKEWCVAAAPQGLSLPAVCRDTSSHCCFFSFKSFSCFFCR